MKNKKKVDVENEVKKPHTLLLNGVECQSALEKNYCVPYGLVKDMPSKKYPLGVCIDAYDLGWKKEEPCFLPTLMLLNEGSFMKIFITDGTDIDNDHEADSKNSIKAQILQQIVPSNELDLCLHGYSGTNLKILVYSIIRKHGKVSSLYESVTEFNYYVDKLVDLYYKFPKTFTVSGNKIIPGKNVIDTISELIIPGKNYHYYRIKNRKIVEEIGPVENQA